MIVILSLGITSLLLELTKLVGNHLQEKQQNPSIQLFRKVKTIKEATLEHFFAISPQTIHYTEAVYDMVRKIYGRPSDDPVEDLDVNVAIWRVRFHRKLKQFFYLEGLLSVCSYSFWRRSNFFKAVERLHFLTRAEFIFFDTQYLPLCEIRPKAPDAPTT